MRRSPYYFSGSVKRITPVAQGCEQPTTPTLLKDYKKSIEAFTFEDDDELVTLTPQTPTPTPRYQKQQQQQQQQQQALPLIPNIIQVQAEPVNQQIVKAVQKKNGCPKRVKEEVWNRYIGDDIPKHRCMCCKLNLIKMIDFQVGHVVSEYHGGTFAISNLRPICASCNHSMGTQNMIEYAKKYEFIIG